MGVHHLGEIEEQLLAEVRGAIGAVDDQEALGVLLAAAALEAREGPPKGQAGVLVGGTYHAGLGAPAARRRDAAVARTARLTPVEPLDELQDRIARLLSETIPELRAAAVGGRDDQCVTRKRSTGTRETAAKFAPTPPRWRRERARPRGRREMTLEAEAEDREGFDLTPEEEAELEDCFNDATEAKRRGGLVPWDAVFPPVTG